MTSIRNVPPARTIPAKKGRSGGSAIVARTNPLHTAADAKGSVHPSSNARNAAGADIDRENYPSSSNGRSTEFSAGLAGRLSPSHAQISMEATANLRVPTDAAGQRQRHNATEIPQRLRYRRPVRTRRKFPPADRGSERCHRERVHRGRLRIRPRHKFLFRCTSPPRRDPDTHRKRQTRTGSIPPGPEKIC